MLGELSDSSTSGDKTQGTRGLIDYRMIKVSSSGFIAATIAAASQTNLNIKEDPAIHEEEVLNTSPNHFTNKVLLHFTLRKIS